MAHDLLRKGGIPALVCVASALDDALFLKCTFQVKFDAANARATFTLRHDFYLDEIADTQSFSLIYNADNLVPTTTQCQPLTRALSDQESKVVARNPTTAPNLRVLSLHLRQPCPITCPNVSSSIVSKASCAAPSQPFVDLAKSTEIEIAFDLKWITPKQVKSFTSIIRQPELFHGFLVNEKNLKGQRLENWTIFSPDDEVAEGSDELPLYTDVVHKRPRQISSSPLPPAKRLFIPPGSPTEKATTASPHSSPWTDSPTEKATTASPNNSKHPWSPSSPTEKATSPPNSSKHHTSRNRESQRSKSSRIASTHRAGKSHQPQTETDTNASSSVNVHYIRLNAIPPMLASTHLLHPHSASSSPSSTEPNTHPLQPTSLRSFLTERVHRHIERTLTTIYEDISYEANMLRQTADEEFLESVAEEKLDIDLRKEDALHDLSVRTDKMLNEKLHEFSDVLDDLFEERVKDASDAVEAKQLDVDVSWAKIIARLDARAEKTAVRDGRAAGNGKRRAARYRRRGRSAWTRWDFRP